MNGKSGNMNNVLAQIYPTGCYIPGNELIAVFDADQIAKPDFFLRTVSLFDAGDDVGMVCFYTTYLLTCLPELVLIPNSHRGLQHHSRGLCRLLRSSFT